MKQTLLEMVQSILSSLDGEEVNSISDTAESLQVAECIKGVYFDMLSDIDLPERQTLVQLNPSNDITKPTIMYIPSGCVKIKDIQYDTKGNTETTSNYQEVCFMPFAEFIIMQTALRSETENVGEQSVVMNGETFKIMYQTNKQPSFYTHVDDTTLIFDSLDNTIDDTLMKSKTMCVGSMEPTFDMQDDFVPSIDPVSFSYLINRAKVRAFNELKQQQNAEAGGEARRQKIIIQKRKRTAPDKPAEVYRVTSRFGRNHV